MRHLLFLGVVLTAVHLNAVQVNGRTISITISPSQVPGGNASVPVWGNEPYIQGPFAFVAAPRDGVGSHFPRFGVRAWHEGDKARIVVYAVLDDNRAPDGTTQTPIRSFTISPGQTVEIPETEKWGAARVSVKATENYR